MKALVLGGCGFIGSHVVDELVSAGATVRVFDRLPEKFRPAVRRVEYRFADFADLPALAEALEGVDMVFHLVSATVPSTSNLDPVSDVQANLVSTIRLLQLLVSQKIPKIVFLSSGGTVYGLPERLP